MLDYIPRFDMKEPPRKQKLRPLMWLLALPETFSHHLKIHYHGDVKKLKPPYFLIANHNAFLDMKNLIRAVMEGVSYSLKDCLGVLGGMGVELSDMRICGGGGKSPFWRQMLADVYGIPVTRIESDEGPALGVAILAMVGAGIYPSVREACDAIVRQKDVTACDAERNARYGQFYNVYTSLYPHLKADFDALAAL